MDQHNQILLCGWFRFNCADHWLDVLRSKPLRVEDPKNEFFLAGYYDPGPNETTRQALVAPLASAIETAVLAARN